MAYLELIGMAVLAVHGAATAIVNVTNTPDPDSKLGKAYRLIELAAGLVTKRSKQTSIDRLMGR